MRRALAWRYERFASGLPPCAQTPSLVSARSRAFVISLQAAIRTSTGSIRSASRYSTRNGRSIELSPGLLRRDCRQVARNSHCRPTSLRRVGTTQHQASGSHTPATIDSFTGTVIAAPFLPEASHAESHESRQEPASFAGKTRRAACKDCACAAAREDRARAVRAAREDRARAATQTVARSRLARRRSRNGGLFSGPSREIELEP